MPEFYSQDTPSESNHPSLSPSYIGWKSQSHGFQKGPGRLTEKTVFSFRARNWGPGRSFLTKANDLESARAVCPGSHCVEPRSAGIGWCPPPTTSQGHWGWPGEHSLGPPTTRPLALKVSNKAVSPHLVPGTQSSGQRSDIGGELHAMPSGFSVYIKFVILTQREFQFWDPELSS